MGNRANVHIKETDGDNGVYLYTHWDGYKLPQTLQSALQKKWRWDDCPYLTRIIFDEMTKGKNGNETGFGISSCSSEDKTLTVNVKKQIIINHNGYVWTFNEFCEDPDVGWES